MDRDKVVERVAREFLDKWHHYRKPLSEMTFGEKHRMYFDIKGYLEAAGFWEIIKALKTIKEYAEVRQEYSLYIEYIHGFANEALRKAGVGDG